ncbi:MAG: SRPBCC family protein [Miltoncostaeaceae bacterium]
MSEDVLETAVVERRIAAPPSRVFELLSSGENWLRWQGVSAEMDVAPGGHLAVDIMGDGVVACGRFEEVVPGERLVFTWGWDAPGHPVPPGSSRVEIELRPDGEGTLLRLTHTVGAETWGAKVEGGWAHHLDRLSAVAGEGAA